MAFLSIKFKGKETNFETQFLSLFDLFISLQDTKQ